MPAVLVSGQWKRVTDDPLRANSIVTSFNRSFAKRADGNPNTHAFIASPEMAVAFAIAGDLCFNPLTDTLMKNEKGEEVRLVATGETLPLKGFAVDDNGYVAPSADGGRWEVTIQPDSQRLQKLEPFAAWNGEDFMELPLLIKTQGKCTTDHISMAAGPWLLPRTPGKYFR